MGNFYIWGKFNNRIIANPLKILNNSVRIKQAILIRDQLLFLDCKIIEKEFNKYLIFFIFQNADSFIKSTFKKQIQMRGKSAKIYSIYLKKINL